VFFINFYTLFSGNSEYFIIDLYTIAKHLIERSLRLRIQVYGANHLYIAQSYNNLARVYESSEEYNEAIILYVKSLKVI